MGTSVGAAIDYLVAGLQPLLTAADPTAVVADNDPLVTSQSLVVVGRSDPTNATAGLGAQMILNLGANRREEDYVIPCFVQVYRPGPKQKPARDAAITLFDVFANLIASDVTLGGVLLRGRRAFIEKVELIQTRDSNDTGDAGALRVAIFAFDVHCTKSYVP